jgi:CRISPR/Cas system-associated exonuclease Cas4 (RecB family)
VAPRTPAGTDSGPGKRKTIRASEIGEYAYCARAWWYKHIEQIEPPQPPPGSPNRLEAGRVAHRRHGDAVAMSGVLRVAAAVVAIAALVALTLAILQQ